MKYTSTNTPIQCFLTNNPCYKGTKKMEVKGVLWHSTGANNKTLKRYVQPSPNDPNYNQLIEYLGKNKYNNSWNNTTRKVGMNAFIGTTAAGDVATVQTMPWDWRPWGCGSDSKGSCNSGWIQFEICEDGLTDKNYFEKCYKEACELTAYMCKMFNLDPQGTTKLNGVTVPVILCHADSHKLKLGNNHGDVYNWFNRFGKTMQDVRNDVEKLLKGSTPAPSIPTPAPVIPEAKPSLNTSSSLVGANNEEKIWNFLLKEINNEFGVAGLMGNLKAESAFNPKNLQNSYEKKLNYTDDTYTLAVDNGILSREAFSKDRAGYGLAQWTYWSRKQGLYDYIKGQNRSIGDLQGQLEYLIKEIKGYKTVWNTLLTAKTVEEASTMVVLQYEKPASKDSPETQAKRASYGKDIYLKFAKKPIDSAPAPAPVQPTPTPIVPIQSTVSASAVRMGHASISENNSINGIKGDSTKKEVCVRKWYNKPWDYVAIYPDAAVRERHAVACEAGCANNNIGYGQSNRNTLNAEAKKVGYDLSKITTPCNTDCSAFMNVCAVASGAPDVTYGSNGWTTSTMKSHLQKAGYKIVTDPTLVSSAEYCVRGAIYVKASAHTACGLDNGPRYQKMLAAADVVDAGVPDNKEFVGKGIGKAKALSTMNIRKESNTSSYSYGTIKKGVEVEVLEVLSNGWYKIVWTQCTEGYAYTSNTTGKYYDYMPNNAVETPTLTPTPIVPVPAPGVEETPSKNVVAKQSAKYKDVLLKGTYVVDASSVNVRDGAGTNYKILTTIPRGTKVKNYGYYNVANDKKWLYVKFDFKGITYTAYITSQYLKKV